MTSAFVSAVGFLLMAVMAMVALIAAEPRTRWSILGIYGMRASFVGLWLVLVDVWTTMPEAISNPRPGVIFIMTVVLLWFAGLFDALTGETRKALRTRDRSVIVKINPNVLWPCVAALVTAIFIFA